MACLITDAAGEALKNVSCEHNGQCTAGPGEYTHDGNLVTAYFCEGCEEHSGERKGKSSESEESEESEESSMSDSSEEEGRRGRGREARRRQESFNELMRRFTEWMMRNGFNGK